MPYFDVEDGIINYDKLLNEMCDGTYNMIIIGEAGTGKSELILNLQKMRPDIVCAAPTGIAALRINGVTLHSFLALKPSIQPHSEINISKIEIISLIEKMNTLLIDEISMVRCDVFDEIDFLLKNIRKNNKPFGGVRLILVGDIFQLPPFIKESERKIMRELYPELKNDFFFFESNIFKDETFSDYLCSYILDFNFRQIDDSKYAKLLKNIRLGKCDKSELLPKNILRVLQENDCDYPYLTTRREMADNINRKRMALLPGNTDVSMPIIKTDIDDYDNIYENDYQEHSMFHVLYIKRGMKCMFTVNDSIVSGRRWRNGTTGKVVDIIVSNDKIEKVIVELDDDCKTVVEVERALYDLYKPFYNASNGGIVIKKVKTSSQFPIIPAWAFTIHKVQGLTLDHAILDLGAGSFAPGQVYVGLTRVRRLGDIYLKRQIEHRDLNISKAALSFYNDFICMDSNIVKFDKKDADLFLEKASKENNKEAPLVIAIKKIFFDTEENTKRQNRNERFRRKKIEDKDFDFKMYSEVFGMNESHEELYNEYLKGDDDSEEE
jgi:ATP-dependent exoDNAse (exonuclease V) alpha subunit